MLEVLLLFVMLASFVIFIVGAYRAIKTGWKLLKSKV